LFKICIVGYTNAGKSTLLNALTDAGVVVEDRLFATLDTRTRKWTLARGAEVLLSDTVGFIKDLPHQLVASFKATLEEAVNADLLLHILDVSNPNALNQIESVNKVLSEIGCAEGTFTAMLASRCDSLLAVDISPTALDRARTRCNAVSHVRFAEWDLRRDTPTDVFDLVVVMDVLTYFARLSALRKARDKLVAAARPGGYLLIANPRQAEIFETAWWGRHLLRGGKWINAFIAEHHDLRLVTAVTDNSSVYTLLRKVS